MTQDEVPEIGGRNHTFEWDDRKRQANLVKHGIDFLAVPAVFDDPHRFTYRSKHPENETRYVTIGKLRGVIVAVVLTVRGDRIRIISARVARNYEREQYGRGQEQN